MLLGNARSRVIWRAAPLSTQNPPPFSSSAFRRGPPPLIRPYPQSRHRRAGERTSVFGSFGSESRPRFCARAAADE